ncbi:MAG: hypothetical protein HWQ38_19100 [Nostoc sp. NMS7]|uniref:hypothetical protein n=1 Tax=Nostoc sp. NMS7 TaxID=2815391 RepID=UPI0026007925|nr:hypothetical protein [Nostoc sp. NMS7]MBN3948444.1 hypothetical protein [Nostoc sp. NMS7]
MKISLEVAAETQVEVFFRLTQESANEKTLPGEIGYIYSAHFCRIHDEPVEYYAYPYVYHGDGKWQMVGRPWFDFEKAEYYTELEEVI